MSPKGASLLEPAVVMIHVLYSFTVPFQSLSLVSKSFSAYFLFFLFFSLETENPEISF